MMNANTLCDITFCIPVISATNIDDSKTRDKNGIIPESAQYKEYPSLRWHFATHSSVFKALIFDNMKKSDINTKIPVKDLSPETFEFIRDYCYSLEPSFKDNIDIIFELLIASHKYNINALIDDIVKFIKTEWIVSKDTLLDFLVKSSKFLEISKHNLLLHYVSRILNNNTVLQQYACVLYQPDCHECETSIYKSHIMILAEVLKCNSFYLTEHLIWHLCRSYCSSQMYFNQCCVCNKIDTVDILYIYDDGEYNLNSFTLCPSCYDSEIEKKSQIVNADKVNIDSIDIGSNHFLLTQFSTNKRIPDAKWYSESDYDKLCAHETFNMNMKQLMPFIKFDIIGIDYFVNAIGPFILQHKLMKKSQLYNIARSWFDEESLQEKFTLKRQRFEFETNYLQINNNNMKILTEMYYIDLCLKNNIASGFKNVAVYDIDESKGTISIHDDSEISLNECIIAKPYTCSDVFSINHRIINLKEGKIVEFKPIDCCDDSDPWMVGRIQEGQKQDLYCGQIEVLTLDGNGKYAVSVNDPKQLKR